MSEREKVEQLAQDTLLMYGDRIPTHREEDKDRCAALARDVLSLLREVEELEKKNEELRADRDRLRADNESLRGIMGHVASILIANAKEFKKMLPAQPAREEGKEDEQG